MRGDDTDWTTLLRIWREPFGEYEYLFDFSYLYRMDGVGCCRGR
jgi:hypothetical protein